MTQPNAIWHFPPRSTPSTDFIQAVSQYTSESEGKFAAQLLWQRGIQASDQLDSFVNPEAYLPTPASAFGEEMEWAIARLIKARQSHEKVAIWGDFDADGVTATSVLWEGIGQFFPRGDRLSYIIPNRLKESHGLSIHGLDALADQGITLIVTCDTGSTNLAEIDHANGLGIDIIVTDHHTLPSVRPHVTAIINPRSLPSDHPLAHLSGVAVAYKLIEALYTALPDIPSLPLTQLLDLVAIGLIADLVELKRDCRYLAQVGIRQLQTQVNTPTRPGIAELLKYCRRSGDRPTDISFGIGPRINAISRIHGDAHFCVDLLTSTDIDQCRQLAEATELANLRRKALQRDVEHQVTMRLAELDLSTTGVIVLADAQWPVGVLGLVAGHIAQTYGRPAILLSYPTPQPSHQGAINQRVASADSPSQVLIARGSARSVNAINLYDLVKSQSHLLRSFGGHPFAAGLSLRVDDIQFFADAINQEFRSRYGTAIAQQPVVQADLTVHVADLGRPLFRELSLLEPYGMGNPIPRLLIRHCWFTNVWNRNIQDFNNRKLNYIKTTFNLWDDSVNQGFPGTWWGHYKEDVPDGRCEALVELDYNSAPQRKHKPHYEIRLIAVRPLAVSASPYQVVHHNSLSNTPQPSSQQLLDWRTKTLPSVPGSPGDSFPDPVTPQPLNEEAQPDCIPVEVNQRPATWHDFYDGLNQAQQQNTPLAIAFPPPANQTPLQIWHRLVGIAKYSSRTQQPTSIDELQNILGIGGRSLQLGLSALTALGFRITPASHQITIMAQSPLSESTRDPETPPALSLIQNFITAIEEEQFRQRFFHEVPTSTLQTVANEFLKSPTH
ncbi:MAG: single-stranded-DNA-specific exonuclease RecJ [Cyanobacteria bacterium P01_E01_bin.6]